MKFLILLILASNLSYARWAQKEDLNFRTLNQDVQFNIKKDGTYSIVESTTFEILKDAGKQKFNIYKIPYQSNSSSLKILEVKVINDEEIIKVGFDKMVDRSVGKDNGMDDTKEIQIALPQLKINSQIFIKSSLDVKKVVAPGHFSVTSYLGFDGLTEAGQITFISEMPLHHLLNDPFGALNFQSKIAGNKYQYIFTLKNPYLHQLIEEKGVLSPEKISFIKVSTDKDWKVIGDNLKRRFDNVLESVLPKELEVVANEAKAIQDPTEKVNHLIAFITGNFNYVGDWRNLDGGFSPRKLKDITSTKYGDCKDFATILVSMLRHGSIPADIALVHRSSPVIGRYQNGTLASLDLFNHAIVRARFGDKTYWLDPTNKVSFGLSHREDIAGKHTLTLDGKHNLEFIPLATSAQNRLSIIKKVQFKKNEVTKVQTGMKMQGSLALMFTGMELNFERSKVENALVSITSHGEEAILPEVSKFDLKTRKFNNLSFDIKYSASGAYYTKDEKTYAKLPTLGAYVRGLGTDLTQAQGDIYIGEAAEIERSVLLAGVYPVERLEGCSYNSKWVNVQRDFEYLKEGLKINDTITFKHSLISRTDYITPDYKFIQNNIQRCLKDNEVEFKFESVKHTDSDEDLEMKFAKLPTEQRAQKVYEYVFSVLRKDLKSPLKHYDLKKLLLKNIAKFPKHAPSYHLLARNVLFNGAIGDGVYSPSQIRETQKIVSQGLKNVPDHQGLYILYLRTLQLDNRESEVKAALPKILSMGEPRDVRDHTFLAEIYEGLGEGRNATEILLKGESKFKSKWERNLILLALASNSVKNKNHEKCIEYYGEVLKSEPKNDRAHNDITQCYFALGRYDEAVQVAKATHSASEGMKCSIVSSSLIRRGDHKLSLKNIEPARNDYLDSLQYLPLSAAYTGLVKISHLKGDFERALSLIDDGAKLLTDQEYYFFDNAAIFHDSNKATYLQLMLKGYEVSSSPRNKVWAGYSIGLAYHRLHRRDELYNFMEKVIIVGEDLLKKDNKDKETLFNLGASIALYGIDADNSELILRGINYLKQAKDIDPQDKKVDERLTDAFRVLDAIKSGRVPASELNYNLRKK